MKPARIRTRKSTLALAAALALGAWPAADVQAATCTWNSTIGNWNALANWLNCVSGNGNPAGVPGAADSAAIGAAGVVTVNNAQRIGALNNAGNLIVDTAGGSLRVTGGITGSGTTTIQGGSLLNLENTQTVAGGTFVFGSGTNNRIGIDGGGKVVTFASGSVIRGQTGSIGLGQLVSGTGNSVINQGLISSDSGSTISVVQSSLTNQAIAEATGAGSILSLQSNVDNTAGTIRATAGGTVRQEGVTVSGGTITTSGGGSYTFANNVNNYLSGVTLTSGSLMDMAGAQSIARVASGMTLNGTVNVNSGSLLNFEGDQTLGGSGSIVFGNTASNNRIGVDGGGKTLTVASGVTIRGQNGTIGFGQLISGSGNAMINNGTISADVAGGVITLAGLTAGITNNGTIGAQNGGTLQLQSNLTGGVGSQLVAGAGSVISQQGVTISGIVNTSGSGNLRPTSNASNYLSGVTLNGNVDMTAANSLERVVGNLVLNGIINVNGGSLLNFEGDQTLSGSGSIVFGSTASNNRIGVDGSNKTLTVASGVTIRGENGTIGLGQLISGSGNAVINNGTISADAAGGVITLAGLTAGITNNGTISALNGGTLQLQSNLFGSPSGQLVAGAGSLISQQGVTISGVINTSGSGNLRPTSNAYNYLSGVTLNGNLDMTAAGSLERVVGNLVLNGIINVDGGSLLNFEGDQTLGGNGSIVFGGASNNRIGVDGGNKTLTVAGGVTIRGQNGTIGLGQLISGSGNALVNQGLISSDSGGTINITGASLVNQSFAQAVGAGSVLRLNSNVDNSAGTLRSNAGGVVLQNGVSVSGGTISNSGGATYRFSSNANNYVSGVTLSAGSNIDMASAASMGRVVNGMVVNGTIDLASNNVLNFEGDQTLSGSGSIVFGAGSNNRVGVDGGGKTLTIASGVTIRGVDGSIGLGQFINGSSNAVVNNGTVNSDSGGTITFTQSALTNNGLVRASNGTLNVNVPLSGTGTLQVDAAGAMNLANGAKTQGQLAMGAAGAALTLGTGNLTITSDYTNAGAGSGNSFNRRAGVSGTGQIVAGADAAQVITGTGVTGGNTANATLTLGNVRVGATTFNYQVGNSGSTGPTLRGAIQTNVNGASLTDARLSGSGVSASNYNAGAPGANSGDLAVTFTAASAGALAPLTGQVLNLRSNFDNITDQKLNIVLAGGAAAYNAAVGSATPSPVTIANQHVGGGNTAALTVTNTAPSGLFTEGLNASFGANTGAANNNGGSIGLLGGGASNGSAMRVGVDTTSAGAKSGTVTLDYQTDGAGTSGLAAASVGSQAIGVSGNVYRLAQANTIAPIDFGNVLANSSQTRTVTVSNLATADGFSEALNAAFGAIGGTNAASFGTNGFINGLLAGATDNTTMTVTLDTSSTGTRTANVHILLASNGDAIGNGLGITALPTQTINLDGVITGTVGNLATAGLSPTTVNFGKFREGAVTSQTQQLTVSNLTIGPGEGLNASFGASSGGASNNSGSISALATGTSNNTTMAVSLGGLATAGAKSGSQSLDFVSDGTFNGGVPTPLASQAVNMTAEVYRLAMAGVAPAVALAARRVGDAAATGVIGINNTAVADGFSEGLVGTVGGAPAGFTVAGPAGTGLLAAGTGTTRNVSLSTASSGVFAGNVDVALVSNGAGTSGFGDLALATQSAAVSGKVYSPASGSVVTGSVDFGVVRVGDTVSAQNITVNNVASATALDDTMRASLTAGGAFTGGGPIAGIVAGGSGVIGVGLNTGTAGVFNTAAALDFLSQNPDMADVSAGSGSVSLTAQVNNLANADFDLLSGLGVLSQTGTDYVLDFGNITLGSMVSALLQLDNDIGGPADLLGGSFNFLDTLDFTYGGWGAVSNLAAGSAFGGLSVGFNALTLGLYTDAIEFSGLGTNASDQTGLAQSRFLLIRANVTDAGTVPEPGTLTLALAAVVIGTIVRRRRNVSNQRRGDAA